MKTKSATSLKAKFRRALRLDGLPSSVRRVVIGVIGGTVLLIGLALTVLPGPAFLVIPLGLAILATEFAWAKHYLDKCRNVFKRKNARKNKDASTREQEATVRG
jgi:uncharacterized protein (TIGR02611 family)